MVVFVYLFHSGAARSHSAESTSGISRSDGLHDERDADQRPPQLPVRLRLDAAPGRTLPGHPVRTLHAAQ